MYKKTEYVRRITILEFLQMSYVLQNEAVSRQGYILYVAVELNVSMEHCWHNEITLQYVERLPNRYRRT